MRDDFELKAETLIAEIARLQAQRAQIDILIEERRKQLRELEMRQSHDES